MYKHHHLTIEDNGQPFKQGVVTLRNSTRNRMVTVQPSIWERLVSFFKG
jgi:nicotinamide mononucleotide (NMN) deamidase PncC